MNTAGWASPPPLPRSPCRCHRAVARFFLAAVAAICRTALNWRFRLRIGYGAEVKQTMISIVSRTPDHEIVGRYLAQFFLF
jgi:hypothetical protein